MYRTKRKKTELWALIALLTVSFELKAQSDCIIAPLNEYLDTTSYVFIFEVDSLIFDPIHAEIKDILGNEKTRIAKGRAIKVFQNYSKLSYCKEITVEWDQVFTQKSRYLLFCSQVKDEGLFLVNTCSYSEKVNDSKQFKKLYSRVNTYYAKKQLNKWITNP